MYHISELKDVSNHVETAFSRDIKGHAIDTGKMSFTHLLRWHASTRQNFKRVDRNPVVKYRNTSEHQMNGSSLVPSSCTSDISHNLTRCGCI